jgi:glycosyltransferase involved in cell wall biosynthesis
MPGMNTLALVVIARNEARCITRCLRSFAGHVDRMLVLDTGSTDDTVALARAAGAEVRHFEWCDDFATARNAALRAAGADWHLVVDADEWLDSGAEALAAWRQTPPHRLGLVDIRNTFDGPQGEGVATAAIARLLPGHVRYQGRIHEQPDTALPAAPSGLRLLHDGYASAQKQAKADRNERLLHLALAEQPHDPYLLYQLGGELALRGAHTQAAGAYAQALQRVGPRASYRGDLVRRMLVVLQALGEWGVAAELLEAELQRYAGSAYFMLTVGNVFWNWAEDQPAAAAAVLPMAEDAWQQALQLSRNAAASAGGDFGHGLQLEQTGEHAALSLAALYERRALAGAVPAH